MHVEALAATAGRDGIFNGVRTTMPLALTEANLGRLPGGANDEEKLSQLCSRAQELSMLLGKVQGKTILVRVQQVLRV